MKNKSLSGYFKKNGPVTPNNQSELSKVFCRKPLHNENRTIKKNDSSKELQPKFCYISPKKLETPHHLLQKSIDSEVSISHEKEQTNIKKKSQQISNHSNYPPKSAKLVNPNISYRLPLNINHSQEIKNLKELSEDMKKKVQEGVYRQTILKQENSYLLSQVQMLQQHDKRNKKQLQAMYDMIMDKTKQIEDLVQKLQYEQQVSSSLQRKLEYFEKRGQQKVEEGSKKLECQETLDTSATDSDIGLGNSDFFQHSSKYKQKLEEQVQDTRHQLYEVRQKLKYSEIQAAMFEKLRQQNAGLYTQKVKLKLMNKKLIKRIQQLQEKLETINQKQPQTSFSKVRGNHIRSSHRHHEEQIDLQLSPEK